MIHFYRGTLLSTDKCEVDTRAIGISSYTCKINVNKHKEREGLACLGRASGGGAGKIQPAGTVSV